MSRWFRFYDDAINDPKILKLPEATRWYWTALLCVASKNNGTLPALDDIAIQLRVTAAKATEIISSLVKATLLDKVETGFAPHNWNGRQYKSDVSTGRVKRFRERERNVSSTVSETEMERPQITETETETEKKVESARKRGARLAPDWKPSTEDGNEACRKLGGPIPASQELLKFHDYWKAQPGQRGTKLDWDATWRNWIRNARGSQNNGKTEDNPRAGSLIGAIDRRLATLEIEGNSDPALPADNLLRIPHRSV
jgi:hypothetical protein